MSQTLIWRTSSFTANEEKKQLWLTLHSTASCCIYRWNSHMSFWWTNGIILPGIQLPKKNSTFLRAILSITCVHDKYVRVFYENVCLRILLRCCCLQKVDIHFYYVSLYLTIISLLFLPNVNYPSPTRIDSFFKEKIFVFCWDWTQYVPSNSYLQYSS